MSSESEPERPNDRVAGRCPGAFTVPGAPCPPRHALLAWTPEGVGPFPPAPGLSSTVQHSLAAPFLRAMRPSGSPTARLRSGIANRPCALQTEVDVVTSVG